MIRYFVLFSTLWEVCGTAVSWLPKLVTPQAPPELTPVSDSAPDVLIFLISRFRLVHWTGR